MKLIICFIAAIGFFNFIPAQNIEKKNSFPDQNSMLNAGDQAADPGMLYIDRNVNGKPTAAPIVSPFKKGNMRWDIKRYLNLSYFNDYNGDTKYGHTNDFGLDFEGTWFFCDHFGAGIDICADWSGSHISSDFLDRRLMGGVNMVYGMSLSDNVSVYGELEGKYGYHKTISTSNGITTSDIDHILSGSVKVGFPILLNKGGPVYLTPDVCYEHSCTDFVGGREKNYRLGVGVHLESYLGCHDYRCDSKYNYATSLHRYDQGNNYINFISAAGYNFGTAKTTFDNIPGTQSQDHHDFKVDLNYGHFVLNNFAVGLDVGAWNNTIKTDNSSTSLSGFTAEPMLTLHAPVTNGFLHNTYIMGGYGFGYEKSEATFGNSTTTQKFNLTTYCIKIGHNFFVQDHMAFVLDAGYESETSKETDSGLKFKSGGPIVNWGLSYRF